MPHHSGPSTSKAMAKRSQMICRASSCADSSFMAGNVVAQTMVTISRAHRPKRSERMKKADRLPGQLWWKTRMLGSVEEVACLQVQACHVALVAAKGDAAAAQQFAAEFDVLDGRVVQACMPLEQLQVAVGTVGIHVVVTKCIARAHPGHGQGAAQLLAKHVAQAQHHALGAVQAQA